jgi:hypothetical protein
LLWVLEIYLELNEKDMSKKINEEVRIMHMKSQDHEILKAELGLKFGNKNDTVLALSNLRRMKKEDEDEFVTSRLYTKYKQVVAEFEERDAKSFWKRNDKVIKSEVLISVNETLQKAIECFNHTQYQEAINIAGQEWTELVMNRKPEFQEIKMRVLKLLIESYLSLKAYNQEVKDFMDHLERLEGGSFDTALLRLHCQVIGKEDPESIDTYLTEVVNFINNQFDVSEMEQRKEWIHRLIALRKIHKGLTGDKWKLNLEEDMKGPPQNLYFLNQIKKS